jgi:Tol biopolymer transport system component
VIAVAENRQSHETDVARLLAGHYEEAPMDDAFRLTLQDRTRRAVASRHRVPVRRWAMRLAAGTAFACLAATAWYALSTPREPLVAITAARPPVTDNAGRALKVGDRLRAGVTVRTGAGGRVTLVTRRASEFTLNANTELALGRRGRTAYLRRGEVYCCNRDHEFARLDTAAGRIHLLGTVLDARTQNHDAVAVTVIQGKVRLANAHGEAVVPAGKRALLIASRPPEPGTAVSTAVETAWYDGRGEILSESGRIAYIVQRRKPDLLLELWTMNWDGTNKRHLKSYLGRCMLARSQWVCEGDTFLPSGDWVVLAMDVSPLYSYVYAHRIVSTHTGTQIWAVNAATGQDIAFDLPAGIYPLYPRRSPDGSRLAFCGGVGPDAEGGVWVYDLRTGGIRKLLSGWIKTPVAWAPDSRRLVASTGEGYTTDHHLVIADAVTGSVRNLSIQGAGASFSPDGTRLVFRGDFREARSHAYTDGVPAEGTVLVLDLTSQAAPLAVSPPNARPSGARWSPDGTRLLYWELHDYGAPQPGRPTLSFTISVAQADGSGTTQVFRSQAGLAEITWASSGEEIYASTDRGILLISADGSGLSANLGGTREDSVLTSAQTAQTQGVVADLHEATRLYWMGGVRAQEGQVAASRAAYAAASDIVAGLMWKYPLANLSANDVLAYANHLAELAQSPTPLGRGSAR